MLKKPIIQLSIALSGLCLMAFTKPEKPLIANSNFAIFPDKAVQGKYTSKAFGDSVLQSDYRSTSNINVSPILQFKLCINGADNELNYDVYHRANITPDGDKPVIVDVVFGTKSNFRNEDKITSALPENTDVLFRVDMRSVLKSFEEKGYYEDVHGSRIYKANFHGVYIAGNLNPLDFQFTNLYDNDSRRLRDDDKDGIYELKLTFNVPEREDQLNQKWIKSKVASKYPTLSSSFPLMNALYQMSLDEMKLNMEADSTFRTGKFWSGVWTRDVSYSIMLAMGMLEPEIAQKSLMRKVRNKRIVQDTGTGGAWPCSSDRVVWALAAWEIYEYTGDKNWLQSAYEITANSVTDDEKNILDPQYGLMRGESSFLDWREQTYPKWMQSADIYASMNLGTNAVYYQVIHVLDKMASELNISSNWHQKSLVLKQNINKYLWLDTKNYYAQYLYGRNYKNPSPRSESLGEAFTVLFDIADGKKRQLVLENTPVLDFGIPCIYPQIPNNSSYHNNAVWPFVEAFWTLANARGKNSAGVEAGIASIMRQSALFLTNKENFVAQDGDYAGTMMNSDRQLWSIGGQLAMVYKVLFGISFDQHQMQFNPIVPKSLKGIYTLKNVRYRKGTYNITIKGYGTGIASFMLDGKPQTDYFIDQNVSGEHNILIELNKGKDQSRFNRVDNLCSAETPTLRIENNTLVWDAIEGVKEYKIFKNGQLINRVAENKFRISDEGKVTEYQIAAVDTLGHESFLSEPVVLGSKERELILDAASFNLPAKMDCDGASAKGYVSLTMANKEALQFSVDVQTAGTYRISFHYANGNGPGNTDNKCGVRSLWLNGQFASSFVFPQRGSNEWSNWGYSNIEKLELKAGTNVFTLQLEPWNGNMNGKVNNFIVDQIRFVKEN